MSIFFCVVCNAENLYILEAVNASIFPTFFVVVPHKVNEAFFILGVVSAKVPTLYEYIVFHILSF